MHNAAAAVLVVEDEPLMLMYAVDFLRDAGFRVYEAFSAREAIDVLMAHDDVRVLLTDLDMPGPMNGLALAHVVRDRWPPMHLVVTSAWKSPPQANFPERAVFLPKPYQPQTVIDWIRKMVA